MNHYSRLFPACMLLFCALPFSAQVLNSTEQRIPPPSPNMTAQQLETEGDSLRARKEYLDSIDYYRSAVSKADTPTLHNKIGVSLLQMSRYSEARKEFERAVKMDKHYAEAHNNLAVAFYQERRYGAAIREYRKAIKANDLIASFHSNLGSAYFADRDFDGATKEYTRALQLDPTIFDHQPAGGVSAKLASPQDRAHYHYLIARMYGRQGDGQRCRLYLSKANEEGYPFVKDALKDTEFAALRRDPAFVEFVRSLKPPMTEAAQ